MVAITVPAQRPGEPRHVRRRANVHGQNVPSRAAILLISSKGPPKLAPRLSLGILRRLWVLEKQTFTVHLDHPDKQADFEVRFGDGGHYSISSGLLDPQSGCQ